MEVSTRRIKELDGVSLEPSAIVLRRAFGEVTEDYGITEENAPMYAAFSTAGKLDEMRNRGAKFFGLFIDGSQVGLVAVEKETDGEYHMKRLAVLPEYWHHGLGRELVEHVIDYVRKLGAHRLYLGMVNENTILKKWYLKMGFREIGVKTIGHLPFTIGFLEKDIP